MQYIYEQLKDSYSNRAQSAFTLVETVVVVAISTIVLLAILTSIYMFYRTNAYTIQQAAAVANSRTAIENIVKDLREASLSASGAFPVAAMSTSSITFYSDVDRDEVVERIRYFLDGHKLKRASTAPVGSPPLYPAAPDEVWVISDDIRNAAAGVPLFTYFDVSGNKITNMSNLAGLAFVKVRLVVNADPYKKSNNLVLYSTATLRNLHN